MTSPFPLKTTAPCPRPLIHESTKKTKQPDFMKLELSNASLKNDVFSLWYVVTFNPVFHLRTRMMGMESFLCIPFIFPIPCCQSRANFSIKFSMKRIQIRLSVSPDSRRHRLLVNSSTNLSQSGLLLPLPLQSHHGDRLRPRDRT